jgi:trans-aconitate methyltransferase
MDRAHELVGDVAAQVLAGSGGPVLDLGCGNAMLLKRIVARAGSHVIPFGLDLQRQHIEHARVVLPENAANFQVGDMFADDLEWKQRRYRLVLISANRLLEVSETKAREFTDCLLTLCDHLLAYRYPSPSPADLDALADRCGLRVEVRTPHAIVANGLRDDEQPVDHIAR